MNLPNRLTIGRLVLCGGLVISLQFENRYRGLTALVLFILASITDWLDGMLARKWNLVTDFGKLMDPLADKVMVGAVYVTMVAHGLVPSWFVVCIIIREFLITGLRTLAATKGIILGAERIGKHKTFTQVATAFVALLILTMRDMKISSETIDIWMMMILNPLILLTLLITVYSGIAYFWKNRVLISNASTENSL